MSSEENQLADVQIEIAVCSEKLLLLQQTDSLNSEGETDPLARLEEAELLVARLEKAGAKLARLKTISATKRLEASSVHENVNNNVVDSVSSIKTISVEPLSQSQVTYVSINPDILNNTEVKTQQVYRDIQQQSQQQQTDFQQVKKNLAPLPSLVSSIHNELRPSSPPSTGISLQRFTPSVSTQTNSARGLHIDLPELSLPDLRSPIRGRYSADVLAARDRDTISRRLRATVLPVQTPIRIQSQHLQNQQLVASSTITAAPIDTSRNYSSLGPAPQPQDKAIARGGGSGGGGGNTSLSNSSSLQIASSYRTPITSSSTFPIQSNSLNPPQTQLPQTQQLSQESLAYAALYYYYAALASAAGQR